MSPGVNREGRAARLESHRTWTGGACCGRAFRHGKPAGMASVLFQQGQHRAAVSRFRQSLPHPLQSLQQPAC